MSNARRNRLAPCAACVAALLSLCACSGGAMLGQLPEKMGGLPASAPERQAETMPYPNVYEPRPVRQSKPLTDDEQKKLESELSNLRDSQNRRANPDLAPALAETKKEATKGAAKPTKEAKPAKPAPGKVADKQKSKAEDAPQKPKKKDDPLVPDQKPPSALKPID
jgi:hypothetical protein